MANLFRSQLDDFFSVLDPEERGKLISGEGILERKYFKKGTLIFAEDENSSELYLLLSGQVEIFKKINKNSKKTLAILDPGTIFGEGALLSDKPRNASAITIQDVEALVIEKEDFQFFVKNNPEAAVAFLLALFKIVNQRLQWANQELVTMYDISRMMHEFNGDIEKLVQMVGVKLAIITQAPCGLIALRNKITSHLEIKTNWGEFNLSVKELEQFCDDLVGRSYLIINSRLIVAIKNLSEELCGVIVLEGVFEWLPGPRKIARTTAEQLGIVLADYQLKESEIGRSKLKQQNIQF